VSERADSPAAWGEILRLAFVALSWLLTFQLLAEHGVRLLPLAIARRLTLESYLVLVHLVTVALGLCLSVLLLRQPRRELGLGAGKPAALGWVLLLAPAIYVAASYFGIAIALPTLLEELARGGRELAQKSSGEFGRAITRSPLAVALIWAVIVSPVSEELLFRGAAWSAVQRLVERLSPAARPLDSLELPLSDGLVVRALRSAWAWLLAGGVATLASTALFAGLHADMPGGLGIVRVASAAMLGLACGIARHHAGTILSPIALHAAYNALSLATARRWVVSEAFPMKLGVPTLLSLIASAALAIAIVLWLVRRFKRA
jgi:membrane protease YdiL (CAAX protease family)